MLSQEKLEERGDLISVDEDQVREFIDDMITPIAFQNRNLWGHRLADALDICSRIGSQLVMPFLESREADKAKKEQRESRQITESQAAKWALGALRFGSTVVFQRSVPKPVLPLFWLQGAVSIGSRSVIWRPLFWDSRRTGAPYAKGA